MYQAYAYHCHQPLSAKIVSEWYGRRRNMSFACNCYSTAEMSMWLQGYRVLAALWWAPAPRLLKKLILAKLSLLVGDVPISNPLRNSLLLTKNIELILSEQGFNSAEQVCIIRMQGFVIQMQGFGGLQEVLGLWATLSGHLDGEKSFFCRQSITVLQSACPGTFRANTWSYSWIPVGKECQYRTATCIRVLWQSRDNHSVTGM